MSELFRVHVFDGNLSEVYDLVTKNNTYEQLVGSVLPNYYFRCTLYPVPYSSAAFSFEETNSGADVLALVRVSLEESGGQKCVIDDRDVALVVFRMEGQDRCKLGLLIDRDPSRWLSKTNHSSTLPIEVATEFLAEYWGHLVEMSDLQKKFRFFEIEQTPVVEVHLVSDMIQQNFREALERCSRQLHYRRRIHWEKIGAESRSPILLTGFLFARSEASPDGVDGVISLRIRQLAARKIAVSIQYKARTNTARFHFNRLILELKKLDAIQIEELASEEEDRSPEEAPGNYSRDEILEFIEEGRFRGCSMAPETIMKTIDAIIWFGKNDIDNLTSKMIAEKAKICLRHYFNFRNGCRQARVKSIDGINVIDLKANR